MYCNDLRDLALIAPARQGADSLKIVSGYATHTMASWHIKELATHQCSSVNIKLIVGMCQFDGLSQSVHDGFNNLVRRNNTPDQSNLICQYVVKGAPVHSKLYLWEKNGTPFCAFIGSANYTQKAFSLTRRELLDECDPKDALKYFNTIESDTIYCNHQEVEENIKILPTHPILEAEDSPIISIRGTDIRSLTLSLLARGGETGTKSGLNWGQRRGREPNQAYIPLPSEAARSDFFPMEGNLSGQRNPHFSVLTDDGKSLILRIEQQNNKAITTPLNNSLIGEYFRRRIGAANGSYIRLEDLERYGRTDVTFYKLDDEQYFMDFSV